MQDHVSGMSPMAQLALQRPKAQFPPEVLFVQMVPTLLDQLGDSPSVSHPACQDEG